MQSRAKGNGIGVCYAISGCESHCSHSLRLIGNGNPINSQSADSRPKKTGSNRAGLKEPDKLPQPRDIGQNSIRFAFPFKACDHQAGKAAEIARWRLFVPLELQQLAEFIKIFGAGAHMIILDIRTSKTATVAGRKTTGNEQYQCCNP